MSLSRAHDDPRQVWTEHRQSAGPGAYRLARPLRCRPALVVDPRLSAQGPRVSVCADRPLVDVDSELLGLMRRAGRCPQGKYAPGAGGCRLAHAAPDAALDAAFDPEDTRASNPTCTLRGTGWNRWQWLCEDPQRFAEIPFETGVNYRAVVKDSHRPLIPRLLADPSLPAPRPTGAPVARGRVAGLDELPPLPPRPHWRSCAEVARIKGRCRDLLARPV